MTELELWQRLCIIAVGSFVFEISWVQYITAIHARSKFRAAFWCAMIGTLSLTVYSIIIKSADSVLSISVYVFFHSLATVVLMWWQDRKGR